jgi:uncharacterized membrane protein (UPF0127 family)
MNKTSYWTTYILIFLLLIMAGLFFYYTNVNNVKLANETEEVAEDKVSIATSTPDSINQVITATTSEQSASTTDVLATKDNWQAIYPKTQDLQIADVLVQASVAKTWAERIKGLSDTPYLPEEVVKLFIFDTLGFHAIWMKDMNYAIDIIWVDAENKIVDIKKNATPESYPESFSPKTEALYVIETKVGFIDKHNIKIGNTVTLPE